MSKKPSWFSIRAAVQGVVDISIFGDIGGFGVNFADFDRALRASGSPETLHIRINSDGGDVYTGFAIYDALRRHRAHKVVTVEGLAASMGSVVAMAGDERIMPENATLMIHNPVGSISGPGEQIKQFGESVLKMRDKIAQAYFDAVSVEGSDLSLDDIKRLMDEQTWIGADDALKMGFATDIARPVKIAAYFDVSRYRNAPAAYGRKRISNARSNPMTKPNQRAAGKQDDFEGEELSAEEIAANARAELLAQQKEVGALCRLAGKPDLAAKFNEDGKTAAEVMAELEKLAAAPKKPGQKPSADAGTELSARHTGEQSEPVVIDSHEIYAAWNKTGKHRNGAAAR